MTVPGSKAPPKLVVEGLCKRYGATTALEPTQLSVPEGEFLTLLGPSGSGKTTLLQLVCGLVELSEGRVIIDGRDQSDTPVHQRDIGLVFQHYALFPHLTVAENIAFPLKMRGRSSAEIGKRVADALGMVHLGHLAERFPRELSGGQQQRVALARCFVYQPSIILMDEPLGALDKKLREHMQIEIKRLHRESGATIIYVTHDQEEALALSDRICLMNHARIEQLGTPQEIYERPRTAFAADFIGISNILRGTFVAADGERRLETSYGRFSLPAGAVASGEGGALVVRPESLRIDAGAQNRVEGRVKEIVYAGSETRLIATIGDSELMTLRLPAGEVVPTLGETIAIGWDRDKAVLVP
ncbi:ABC-type spermidine/putrescine transport system, ATPase component precursor [Bosea sp. LC85]|uniref:ABC transporter ATP-binding protein n=1 Tax=Bosea sp. LC85 TaxID=1502851 RepID=UPI0004E29532|nr:ABC transporter ATP-binding protein [Bosea sp. LC85]KFC71701.1 ABC-type spermidine/putrescine transport system, ATPase component precursor [Bosea sp. LC85]